MTKKTISVLMLIAFILPLSLCKLAFALQKVHTYDEHDRLIQTQYLVGEAVKATVSYTLDDAGNILRYQVVADNDVDGLLDSVESGSCTSATNPDSDGDGLKDGEEDANHNGQLDDGESSPCLADTDSDGLNDAQELAATTDPRDPDSDDDGFNDGLEVAKGTNPKDQTSTPPLVSGQVQDEDGQGLADISLTFTGEDGSVTTSADGAYTSMPLAKGWTGTVTPAKPGYIFTPSQRDLADLVADQGGVDFVASLFVPDGIGHILGIIMASGDSDGDGLLDTVESRVKCLSATNPDSDGDGLDDGVEDANHNGVVDEGETSPCSADSDGDGIDDGVEDANQDGVKDESETDPRLKDTDGDGMPDGFEVRYGLDPLVNDADEDLDKDTFTNLQECRAGTNPADADSCPGNVLFLPYLNLLLRR